MAVYVFLDEQRTQLSTQQRAHVTLGQVRHAIQRTHYCRLIDWIHDQFSQGTSPSTLYHLLAA